MSTSAKLSEVLKHLAATSPALAKKMNEQLAQLPPESEQFKATWSPVTNTLELQGIGPWSTGGTPTTPNNYPGGPYAGEAPTYGPTSTVTKLLTEMLQVQKEMHQLLQQMADKLPAATVDCSDV